MKEKELEVCAIALFANGASFEAIARALGVDRDKAAELAAAGGNAQAAGEMGYMKNGRYLAGDESD